MCDKSAIMTLKVGLLLALCISPGTGTDMCDTSETGISCESKGTSSLLGQCSAEENPSRFGAIADAIRQFVPDVQRQQCGKQLVLLADALTNSSLWAVQMLDASAKTVEGDGYHLGHFDECIDVNGDHVRGKYCLVDVSKRLRMGICVPDKCGPNEVQTFMERYISEVNDSSVVVRVAEESCVTKRREQTVSALFKYGVLGLVIWSVFVTLTDLVSINLERSSEIWRMLFDIFSYGRNIRKLTSTDREKGLSGIHFMRVMTIFVLIMYQRHQLMSDGPVKNRSYLEKVSLSPSPIFDALIFIAGFLTVHRLQKESLTKKRECVLICIGRWLRMTPLYAAVIAFYAVALDDLGNGPLWSERIGRESRRCGDFWWANLSLVNNYISATGQCIAQSWYLAVTSHGFVVTLIFMHLKTGKAFVGLGSLAVSLTTFLVLFLWNDYALHGHAIADLYIRTQYRLPAFILGGATGLLYHHIQDYRDKTNWAHFLVPFALTILGLVSMLCHRLDTESKMLFALVSSLTWSAFIGCVIIIIPLYNIGVSSGALLSRVSIPLSRLSYPALLSHNIVQLYMIGTMRTSEYVTLPRLVWMGAADILASYISAFFLYLIIDRPVMSAIKIMLWSKEKEIDETTEEGIGKK